MTKEEVLDSLAEELSQSMFYIITNWKGYEREAAQMMAQQLGTFIAIGAKNPRAALDEAAQLISKTPWSQIRADHFGYLLGVAEKKINLVKPNVGNPLAIAKPSDDF